MAFGTTPELVLRDVLMCAFRFLLGLSREMDAGKAPRRWFCCFFTEMCLFLGLWILVFLAFVWDCLETSRDICSFWHDKTFLRKDAHVHEHRNRFDTCSVNNNFADTPARGQGSSCGVSEN